MLSVSDALIVRLYVLSCLVVGVTLLVIGAPSELYVLSCLVVGVTLLVIGAPSELYVLCFVLLVRL
jgi:hypothetical protein